MKPEKPITRKEMYLDVATGGSTELPSPVTREEKYLAKIAGESVDVPTPVTRYEMLLAAVAGESYTLTPVTRLEIYLAKAAGQDVEIPQPVTREEMYWFDYCGGTPTPPEREYTGAVPVTFVADGTPLIDLLISGNEEHSGTPTPENPVMPEGTGERTGNLFDINATPTKYSQSTTVTVDGRTLTITGSWYIYYEIDVIPNTDYYVTWILDYTEIEGRGTIAILTTSGQTIKQQDLRPFRFNSGENQRIRLYIYSGNNEPTTVTLSNIMLNTGSTALPYEPYGYKIPISCGGTTNNVYLGEVQTTRQIKKLVLTGEEFMNIPNTDQLRVPIGIDLPQTAAYGNLMEINTHFIVDNSSEGTVVSKNNYTSRLAASAKTIWFFIPKSFFSGEINTQNCKAQYAEWLASQYTAGTPVTVWYVLATPETAVVNEPLMKIGDYADTLSMEQAGVSIPTVNGSTTLDVETTVKPSEVYIKYRGEAVATLSMLSAEVSSPEETTEEVNPEETEETENGSEDVSLQHKPEVIE